MENQKKKKNFFFVKLGIFCLELGKNILFGNGAEFRPQNRVIESPDHIANGDLLDWYFITQQQGIF